MVLDAVMAASDWMHRAGVYFILWLQRVVPEEQGQQMVSITRLGDPDFLILYIFPFISAVNGNLFIMVVLTTALVDMLNNILKWVLHGERPYWYVHEIPDNSDLLSLKQFSLTCETGPGSPSGHAMLTSAIWYIILWAYTKAVVKFSKQKVLLTMSIWILYLTLFTLVSVSRLYIAAHFPHQVIAGGITGLTVGWYFTRLSVIQFEPKHFIQILTGMAIFATVVYCGLIFFGIDPSWTLHFAKKWCANPTWIHLSTTPLSSLYRDSGAVVGLALARYWEPELVSNNLIHKDGREIVTALISFACVQLCACLPVFHYTLYVYYACVFVKHCMISFVAIAVVPKIVKLSLNLKEFPITPDTKIKEIFDLTRQKRKMTAGF